MQLSSLTTLIDFLNMAIALWMAVYIFSRGRNNRITFRVVILLLAIAFFFFNAFTYELNPSSRLLRTGSLLIAIVAAHNLTYYLLPDEKQMQLKWLPRVVFGLGLVAAFVLAALPSLPKGSNTYIYPPDLSSWSVGVDAYFLLASLAILYNLVLITRMGYHPLNLSFYFSLSLGLAVVGYVLAGSVLNLLLPRLIASLLMLAALILLGYSVARHQVLIERRTTYYDFAISALAISGITLLFLLIGLQMNLSAYQLVVIAILVITTFSAYDLVRDSILRYSSRREQRERREVYKIARHAINQSSMQESLANILELLCQNLQATSGFIGVLADNEYLVKATQNSFPLGECLPKSEVEIEDLTQPEGLLRLQAVWLAPAYCGGQQIAVIGIGPRSGLKGFTERDLYWLEDVADHTAKLIYVNRNKLDEAGESGQEMPDRKLDLTTLVQRTDPETIKLVEYGLKNLHDYIVLGKCPLAELLPVSGETHIERGKAVHDILVETIQTLRPIGDRPEEPLPKEWHNYAIINDAYVEDILDREIMARLYISEGTYYRTRRKALRGLTRALLELDRLECYAGP